MYLDGFYDDDDGGGRVGSTGGGVMERKCACETLGDGFMLDSSHDGSITSTSESSLGRRSR